MCPGRCRERKEGDRESGVETFWDVDAGAVQRRVRVCRVLDPGPSGYRCTTCHAVGGWVVVPWQELRKRDPLKLGRRGQGDVAVVRRGGSVPELCNLY